MHIGFIQLQLASAAQRLPLRIGFSCALASAAHCFLLRIGFSLPGARSLAMGWSVELSLPGAAGARGLAVRARAVLSYAKCVVGCVSASSRDFN